MQRGDKFAALAIQTVGEDHAEAKTLRLQVLDQFDGHWGLLW